MAKKKQPDFQPTKLRVGKHLPKGRNVTNTSFKSKKIVTKDQKLKTSADNASLTDLVRLTHHNNVAVKTEALKRIGKYIHLNDSTLPAYFSEILNAMGKLLLDFHPKVRQEALTVIKTSADLLSGSQMSAFMAVITSNLNCMMTHINLSIKKDSLDLLSSLLKIHPTLICHSTKLLYSLLNMISSVKAHKGDSSLNQKKRKLDDNISTTITSVEWRDQVMKLISEFLENLVNTYTKQKLPCEDEQKVHYDGKKPLFIQLYAGGGLTPRELKYTSDLRKSKSKVTRELKSFFKDVVSVASDVVTEEIAGLNVSSDHNILRPDNVEHLNTVTQVLCCIADWYDMDSGVENIDSEDKDFIPMMNGILRKKLMKGFCYKMHESALKKGGRKNKEVSCVHLNLGIGSLYCFFILGTEFENAVLEKEVLWLVTDVLNKFQYQDVKTTSLVLKILKSFLRVLSKSVDEERNKYNEEFKAIFDHLCDMAGRCRDKALAKEIHSFFIKLSLDYDYKFLLDCKVLDPWTHYSFRQIKRMYTERKIDRSLLKCINIMCSREYPSFMEDLKLSNPSEIIGFLNLDDEDYQVTVINLITHLTNLPANFLRTVAEYILSEQSLSCQIIARLIRSLHNRFADQRVGEEEFKDFCRFLLNVSFDVVAVQDVKERYSHAYSDDKERYSHAYSDDDEEEEEEVNAKHKEEEYSEDLITLLLYVQNACHYTIVPTKQWERHSKILEVCLECLVIHQDREVIISVTNDFFHELLNVKRILPIHSVLALLKLTNHAYMFEDCAIPHNIALACIDELLCCSMFYISAVTSMEHPTSCKALGVGELQNSIDLDQTKGHTLFQMIIARLYDQGMDEMMLLHVLRIIKFLRIKNKITSVEMLEFQQLFRAVEMYCTEDSQPLAILVQIYELMQKPSA